jgi:hypothetical protein
MTKYLKFLVDRLWKGIQHDVGVSIMLIVSSLYVLVEGGFLLGSMYTVAGFLVCFLPNIIKITKDYRGRK